MLLLYSRERRKREGGRGATELQECCIVSSIVGMEEMIRDHNRINKWREIYIQKCTRRFLFLMLVQRAYKKVKLLNVHSLQAFIDKLFWVILYWVFEVRWLGLKRIWFGFVWFGGFYGISTFVGYLTPNPFLCESVLFKTSTVCQKHFYFKLFKQLYVTIQLIVNTVLMSKTVLFQIIQLSIIT